MIINQLTFFRFPEMIVDCFLQPPAPPMPPMSNAAGGPPPPPPPLPNLASSKSNGMDMSSLAAQLQAAKLKKSTPPKTSTAPLQPAENSGSSTSSGGSGNYGTIGNAFYLRDPFETLLIDDFQICQVVQQPEWRR